MYISMCIYVYVYMYIYIYIYIYIYLYIYLYIERQCMCVYADPQNCIAMFAAGAMPYLIQGMKSDIEGMRAACAQTARNIYVLGKQHIACACINNTSHT